MKPYHRQILLPDVGTKGQVIIMSSKVLVVGAGGLGHPVIQYLAAMGVGCIGIVDGDQVQESNLHRQVLFNSNDIGKNKANCLKEKYQHYASHLRVKAYSDYLNYKMAQDIFPEYDVIVDGTDNFDTKFLINEVCCYLEKPMIYGAISQFEGQVSVFWRGQGPCYKCLLPAKPTSKIQSCAEAGVIGALPGVIGSIQAIETLKVLMKLYQHTGRMIPLIGKIQIFNFLDNTANTLKLNPRSECSCQRKSYVMDMSFERESASCSFSKEKKYLDVREQEEWDEFHIPESFHWPLSKLEQGLIPTPVSDIKLTAICRSGYRAQRAVEILKEKGYQNIDYTMESIYEYKNWQN